MPLPWKHCHWSMRSIIDMTLSHRLGTLSLAPYLSGIGNLQRSQTTASLRDLRQNSLHERGNNADFSV